MCSTCDRSQIGWWCPFLPQAFCGYHLNCTMDRNNFKGQTQQTEVWETITQRKKSNHGKPCSIHVARSESLLLRLLKAVLMPTTIKYFLFLADSGIFKSWDKGELLSTESWRVLAAANFISKSEIVLSRVLHFVYGRKWCNICHFWTYKTRHRTRRTYCVASAVLETFLKASLNSPLSSFW